MNINKWKDKALKYNNINDITIILIGNKCDLNAQRVIQQNEASEFAINNNMLYYEISMNDIFQIKQIFNTVVYLWSRDVQNNKTESQINSSLSNDEILTPLIQISQTVQTSPTMQTEPNDMHKKLYNELNDKLFNKLQKNLYDDLHEKLHKEKVYNDLQEKVFQETTRNELSKKLHDEL
jgi:GTPase SAR1 family protein